MGKPIIVSEPQKSDVGYTGASQRMHEQIHRISRTHPRPAQPSAVPGLGIVIVDHGSRLAESNQLLEELVRRFAARFSDHCARVEPAHMELAEPTIAAAYGRCVSQGAEHIVVLPFFLGPGKHWAQDIPQLTAAAAAKHPGTRFQIAAPLGIDDLILDLLEQRLQECLGGPSSSPAPTTNDSKTTV